MLDPCIVCGKTVYDTDIRRQIGSDVWYLCSYNCAKAYDRAYVTSEAAITVATEKMEAEERKGADEQPGWRFHRWWNQTYDRNKAAWEQKKVEREFRRIQRKARRSHE